MLRYVLSSLKSPPKGKRVSRNIEINKIFDEYVEIFRVMENNLDDIWNYYIIITSYYYDVILSYYYSVTLSYYCISIWSYYYIIILSYYYMFILSYYYIVILS